MCCPAPKTLPLSTWTCPFHPAPDCLRQYRGFTLLEILLATVILLIGLTAVLQTTRSALQRMTMAKELTEVQNACQAILNEWLARSSPMQPEADRAVAHLPHWKIRVDIYPAAQEGLYVIHLSAQQFLPNGISLGIKYHLVRWIPGIRVSMPEQIEIPIENEFDNLFR